jgi:NodT family efflux transporter outer membrane factor (OMF) lipoprotein
MRMACTAGLSIALLAACAVGPDYLRPAVPVAAQYKEQPVMPPPSDSSWKLAEPADAVPRGAWWTLYRDATLNALEAQVANANQNFAAAQARYRAAKAAVEGFQSAYFPIVTANAAYSRARSSANVLHRSTAGFTIPDYVAGASASWEPDLWGRVSRSVEGARASADASAADAQSVLLSVQAELAADYVALRSTDAELKLLHDTIAAYAEAVQLMQHRLEGGIATEADVAQADTQLKTTQAQAIDLGVQRAQLEHAIAILIGQPPAQFTLAAAEASTGAVLSPIILPVGLPSTLLERRPDIAAAERRVAAANAQVGVATAAFFPSLVLTLTGGFESTNFAPWLTAPSRFWSLGPELAGTILDFGGRKAVKREAVAQYDETVAIYRQTVLNAFGEVEDNLATLRVLAQEAQAQDDAVKAAQRSLTATSNRYESGALTYLDVVVTQTTVLNTQRTALAIERRRMTASIALVKALGGDWRSSANATAAEVSDTATGINTHTDADADAALYPTSDAAFDTSPDTTSTTR